MVSFGLSPVIDAKKLEKTGFLLPLPFQLNSASILQAVPVPPFPDLFNNVEKSLPLSMILTSPEEST